MTNASVTGLKCPGCGEPFSPRVEAYSGSFYADDPPEIQEVVELNRECDETCGATDDELRDITFELGTLEFDDDDGGGY